MNIKQVKLENGLTVREMTYKQNNRTKNLIVFLLVAVIVGALAFAGCFIALEISRTNAYNQNLHNSIITNPTPTIPDEPAINPTDPDNNNQSGSGNVSGETETNDPPASQKDLSGRYRVVFQTVWGLSDKALSFQQGKNQALTSKMWLTVKTGGNAGYLSQSTDLWCGTEPMASNPSYVGIANSYNTSGIPTTNRAARTASNKNNAIGIRKDYKVSLERWISIYVHFNFNCSSEYKLAFMTMDTNGTMKEIKTGINYTAGNNTNTVEFDLKPYIQSKNSFTYIYVVLTRKIDIPVTFYGNSGLTKVNIDGGSSFKQLDGAVLKTINAYNCVYGAIAYDTNAFPLEFYFDADYAHLIPKAINTTSKPFTNIEDFNVEKVEVSKYSFTLEGPIWGWYLNGSDKFWLNTKLMSSGAYSSANNTLNVYVKDIICKIYECTSDSTISNPKITGNTYYCFTNTGEENHLQHALGTKFASKSKVCVEFISNKTFTEDFILNTYSATTFITTKNSSAITNSNKMFVISNQRGSSSTVYLNIPITNVRALGAYTFNLSSKLSTLEISGESTYNLNTNAQVSTIKKASEAAGSIAKIINFNGISTATTINLTGLQDVTIKGDLKANATVQFKETLSTTKTPLKINASTTGLGSLKLDVNYRMGAGTYYLVKTTSTSAQTLYNSIKNNITYPHSDKKISYSSSYVTLEVLNTVLIDSFAKLKEVAGYTKYDDGFTYLLTADIDIEEPVTIGTDDAKPFNGTFDGQGFRLNYKTQTTGLFGCVGNFTIKNLLVTGTLQQYGLIDTAIELGEECKSKIENVVLDISLSATYYDSAGMLRYNYKDTYTEPISFINCSVTINANYYGAINVTAGLFVAKNWYGYLNFYNCYVEDTNLAVDYNSYNGYGSTGIFVGNMDKSCTGRVKIYHCVVDDNEYSYGDNYYVGYCDYDLGKVTGTSSSYYCNSQGVNNCIEDYNFFKGTYSGNKTGADILNEYLDSPTGKDYISGAKRWHESGCLIMFEIDTAQELQMIAAGTDMEKRAAVLINDITVSSGSWSGFEHFYGYFDGAGKTITFAESCTATEGLVRYQNNGTIYNLIVSGTIYAGDVVGGIAAANFNTIKGCSTENLQIYAYGYGAGGIAGANYGIIENCSNNCTITIKSASANYIGGIVGQFKSVSSTRDCYIKNCSNTVEIVQDSSVGTSARNNYIGGFVGYIAMNTQCQTPYLYFTEETLPNTKEIIKNEATINLFYGTPNYVGGFIGYYESCIINKTKDFANNVNIKINAGQYIGGLVGYSCLNLDGLSVNKGTITTTSGGSYVGGIAGCATWQKISNCSFNGNITSTASYSGGIAGYADVEKCIVNGDCVFTGNNCAGITASGNVSKCVFKGKLTLNGSNSCGITAYSDQAVTECVIDGKIYVNSSTLPSGFAIFAAKGATSCLFNGNVYTISTGEIIETVQMVGDSCPVNLCFIKGSETKILEGNSNWTNCATFISLNSSLVWNGSYFGYVKDALSGNPSSCWASDSSLGGTPNPILTRGHRTTELNIVDLDNLNSINDCIVKTSYVFKENFIFAVAELELDNFAGIGYDSDPMIMADGKGFKTSSTSSYVHIYLNNSCLFNNIQNATIRNINTYLKDGATTPYPLIKKSTNCIIKQCANQANIVGGTTQDKIGGIALSDSGSTFELCNNYSVLTTSVTSGLDRVYMGGIVAYAKNSKFTKCFNRNTINTKGYEGRIGGIVGEGLDLTFTNCFSLGDLINAGSIGGIVGLLNGDSSTFDECFTNCYISAKTNAGGIVGVANSAVVVIENCITDGLYVANGTAASGVARVAGLVANSNCNPLCVTDCVSFATIKNVKNQASTAGIVASSSGWSEISYTYFFGDFVSTNYSTLVVGDAKIICCGYNINNTVVATAPTFVSDEKLDWYAYTEVYNNGYWYYSNWYYYQNEQYIKATVAEVCNSLHSTEWYFYIDDKYISIYNLTNTCLSDLFYYSFCLEQDYLDENESFDWYLSDEVETIPVYVKENPVYSTSAYIKLLVKTEAKSVLNCSNEKLVLIFVGGASEYFCAFVRGFL